MPQETRSTVSEAERHVLRALWQHGPSSVRDVHRHLKQADLDWARSTVITLLQRLEKKGFVESDKSEFAFTFRAVVTRDELVRLRMSELAEDLCDGQWEPLLLAFTQREKLSSRDLAELQRLVDDLSARLDRQKKEATVALLGVLLMVTLLLWLGANALVVAALMPLVWLLCRLLRSRPAAQHLLWFLLLLKLVAPPVLDWPWSVDLLMHSLTAEPQLMAQSHSDAPIGLEGEHPLDLVSDLVGIETVAIPLASEISATTGASATRLSIASVAVLAWGAGALVLLAFTVVGLWRQRQILRNSVGAPEHLVTAVRRIAGGFGLRTPRLAVSDQITTPAVCCLGTPRLIWPATMTARSVVADCDGVVAHELAHLARRDHYFLYAELVVTVCCWWNPLMWIIRRRLCETRELACDARALAAVAQPRSDYAQRLLNLSVSRPDLLLFAPAFGAGNVSRRFLRRRLIMVFDERIQGRLSAGGILLAAVLFAVGLPGFTLADPPSAANSAGSSDAASTTSAAQSSASSVSNDSDAAPADPDEPRTTTGRSLRLSKVIKSEEISADKAAEISLGNSGTIRITKNEQGDLVVTVEHTEVSESPRRRRIVINRTGAEELALDSGGGTATTSRGVERGSGSASSFSSRSLSSDASAPDLDRELLRSDVALAEVNLMEQRVKLEMAKKANAATAGSISEGSLSLAELAVRRAEIELNRAKLRLSRGESTRSRR